MRELYSSEPNIVKFTTSVQGRPTRPQARPNAELHVGSEIDKLVKVHDLNVDEVDNGEYEISIPQRFLVDQRVGQVRFSYDLQDFGPFFTNRTYDITRRLIDFEELNDVLGERFAIDYNQFTFVETDVRKIIESYCNQSFNCWKGIRVVEGQGGHILLPEPLEHLETVHVGSSVVPGYTRSEPGFVITDEGHSIYNADRADTVTFFHGKEAAVDYLIDGTWGYSSIPSGVHQAALELAKGFLCDDIEYRRRYIKTISAGDTRIEFHNNAYNGSTGNPIADAMLDPFRVFLIGAV